MLLYCHTTAEITTFLFHFCVIMGTSNVVILFYTKSFFFTIFGITIFMNMHTTNAVYRTAYRQYILKAELNNRSCALSDLTLNEGFARSITDCLSLCAQLGKNCTSVFYLDDGVSRMCHGCCEIYLLSSVGSLEYLIGSDYYVTGKAKSPFAVFKNIFFHSTSSRNKNNTCTSIILCLFVEKILDRLSIILLLASYFLR